MAFQVLRGSHWELEAPGYVRTLRTLQRFQVLYLNSLQLFYFLVVNIPLIIVMVVITCPIGYRIRFRRQRDHTGEVSTPKGRA